MRAMTLTGTVGYGWLRMAAHLSCSWSLEKSPPCAMPGSAEMCRHHWLEEGSAGAAADVRPGGVASSQHFGAKMRRHSERIRRDGEDRVHRA